MTDADAGRRGGRPARTPAELEERWTKLGAGFAGAARVPTPDVERLLLDTARHAAANPRLLIVAVTWLSRYAMLVAEHRLHALVQRGDLAEEHRPVLGLMLDLASSLSRCHDRRRNLARTMKACAKAPVARPLFDVERASAHLVERAERRASDVSRRWNLWVEPIEPKYDALRPIAWIVAENPDLAFRADFKGDLRASILLTLREDPAAGRSVSELSRQCGASRPAVVSALEELELGRHVRRLRSGRVCEVALGQRAA